MKFHDARTGMKFHVALKFALKKGVKTLRRKDRPHSFTLLTARGFFRDDDNSPKIFTHEDMLVADWEVVELGY